MANADTQIRVGREDADWLNELRDRHGFASVAVVIARLRQLYGDDFERRMDTAVTS